MVKLDFRYRELSAVNAVVFIGKSIPKNLYQALEFCLYLQHNIRYNLLDNRSLPMYVAVLNSGQRRFFRLQLLGRV